MFKTFKEFLQAKGISDDDFTKKSPSEVATLQSEYQKESLAAIKADLKKDMDDSKKGLISNEEFDTKTKTHFEKLAKLDPEKFEAFKTSLEKLEGKLKTQGIELGKLKDVGAPGSTKNPFKKALTDAVESQDFKDMVDSNGKKKASFTLKAVSITDDYTGTSLVHITTRDSRVVDHPQVTRLNIRDLLTVMPADLPFLAFTEVFDWDRAVDTVSENGSLPESSFKVREKTVDVKRIGTHVTLSKRMLRSASFVVGHLMQRLPAQVKYNEDFQLLFGDGLGNNVEGIFQVADDFATLINASITGATGSVTSIATYDGGDKTLVTFTANQLINNGDTITFAATTGTTYDGDHKAIVKSPTQIVIEQAFTSDANVLANWTFSVSSPFKDAIPAAQQIDVLKVAKTLVTVQEYSANGIVLNPVDATLIETLKGNDEHYIDVKRLDNGILTISGTPVVETTAIPAGKFAVGDWAMAAAIGQFTELTLEFSESTTQKLTNTVEAIIQEEILFPIYNKFMFVVGDFATAIPAIKV